MTGKRRVLRDVAIAVALLVVISLWQTRDLVGGGEVAPTVVGRTLDGAPFTLTPGQPTLVYFIAPWCGVCKVSAANAETAAAWTGGKARLVYVALAFETEASVAEFAKEAGLTSPVVLASDEVGKAFKIGAFPTYYTLDAELRVKNASVGYSPTLGIFARALRASL